METIKGEKKTEWKNRMIRKDGRFELLLKLLSEFASEDFNWEYRDGKIYDRQDMYPDGDLLEEMSVYVISKKFGFVKWLWDNEYIDYSAVIVMKKFWSLENEMISLDEQRYCEILMLLSISEDPIRLLIYILR